jgi:hypothetical protein
MLFSDPDTILKYSLLWVGECLSGEAPSYELATEYPVMESKCKALTMHPIKHPDYRWSNSGSENLKDNTLFKRPTYVLYHEGDKISWAIIAWLGASLYNDWWVSTLVLNILLWFSIWIETNPRKGASIDQLRAYWLVLYMCRNKKVARKHLLGFILRLGFAPSLMENILFKPQSAILLLATVWEPLKYLAYPFYKISKWRNLRIGTWDNTTNKISLLPTMFLLGHKFSYPKDVFYIKRVYDTYFCQEDNKVVGAAMIKGMTHAIKCRERAKSAQ